MWFILWSLKFMTSHKHFCHTGSKPAWLKCLLPVCPCLSNPFFLMEPTNNLVRHSQVWSVQKEPCESWFNQKLNENPNLWITGTFTSNLLHFWTSLGNILGCMDDRITLSGKFLLICFCFSCCLLPHFKFFFFFELKRVRTLNKTRVMST